MKTARLISTTIASVIISFAMLMPASAVDAGNVGAATATVVGAGIEAYNIHVLLNMVGRAGASFAEQAKGIAFEILECDKFNFQNMFTDANMSLSESSIDPVADLVEKKGDEIVRYIQCKVPGKMDSARTMVYNADKYASADIVSTTEGAKLLRVAAKNAGKDLSIIDSGISASTAERIGRLRVGGSTLADLTKAAGKTVAVGTAFSATIATVEAIYSDYDFDEAMGHIAVETAEGAIIGGLSGLAAAGTTAALAGAGITTTAAIAAPVVAGGAVAFAGAEALNYVSEKTNAKETVSAWVDNVQEYTVNGYHTVRNKIEQSKTLSSIGSAVENVKDSTTALCRSIVGK